MADGGASVRLSIEIGANHEASVVFLVSPCSAAPSATEAGAQGSSAAETGVQAPSGTEAPSTMEAGTEAPSAAEGGAAAASTTQAGAAAPFAAEPGTAAPSAMEATAEAPSITEAGAEAPSAAVPVLQLGAAASSTATAAERSDAEASAEAPYSPGHLGYFPIGRSAVAPAAEAALVAAMSTETGKAELKALFSTLDKDSDGSVTSKEWGKALSKNKELMAKYFGGVTMAEIGKAFKRIDADSSGDLTWEEFEAAAARLMEGDEPSHTPKAATTADPKPVEASTSTSEPLQPQPQLEVGEPASAVPRPPSKDAPRGKAPRPAPRAAAAKEAVGDDKGTTLRQQDLLAMAACKPSSAKGVGADEKSEAARAPSKALQRASIP